MAHRRMRDPRFQQTQVSGAYDEHIAPINRLVDRLRHRDGRGWMPHVAPIHGGVNARLLFVLRDPGPKTNSEIGPAGSGFLCLENDDASAERLATLLEEVGLKASDCTPWNAYPWYINAAPNAEQLEAGAGALRDLLSLLPRLQVVMLLGDHAQRSWRRLGKRRPEVVRRYRVIETRHTSNQAFIGTVEERAGWPSGPSRRRRPVQPRPSRRRRVVVTGQPVAASRWWSSPSRSARTSWTRPPSAKAAVSSSSPPIAST